jgi:hypothetical protein
MKKKNQQIKDTERNENELVELIESALPDIKPQVDVIPFTEGDIVYHKIDDQECRGMVLGVMRQPGHYKYLVRWQGMDDLFHYDFELTKTPYIPPNRDSDEEEEEEED